MKDESSRLDTTVRALARSELGRDGTQLVFVDDGSGDGSAEVAERLLAELGLRGEVVRLGRNLGKGGAIRAGVYRATGASIAFCDADLSTPPDAVVASFELVESGRADVVVATRLHEDSAITEMPPLPRRVAGKVFNTLLRGLQLTEYSDTQCGLKAFTDKAAEVVFRDLEIQRFAFDVEVLLRAELADLRVVELPVSWRHVESSRVRPLRDGARMLFDVVRLRRRLGQWKDAGDARHPMAEDRFPVMAELEREHWWFRAKRELVADEIDRLAVPRDSVLDVGCGTGATVEALRCLGFQRVAGSDLSVAALTFAAVTGAGEAAPDLLLASEAGALPFAEGTFSHLVSLDVIEHLDDDVAALREYSRAVRPGGAVLVAVPAYRWAWSDHDVTLGHRRRYTADRLSGAAVLAGLRVERVTHYHSWLVPLAFVLRKTPVRLLLRRSAEEASFVSPPINRLLVVITEIERRVLRRFRIPFGLSILLVARRP